MYRVYDFESWLIGYGYWLGDTVKSGKFIILLAFNNFLLKILFG